MLLAIPKATPNNNPNHEKSDDELLAKTKSETIKEMGYGREYKDYQQMAKNPEIVQKVIDEAIANGEVVTKTQVLKEIKAERDKIKAEITDLREERDYFKSQIEISKPRTEPVGMFDPVLTVQRDDNLHHTKTKSLTNSCETWVQRDDNLHHTKTELLNFNSPPWFSWGISPTPDSERQ